MLFLLFFLVSNCNPTNHITYMPVLRSEVYVYNDALVQVASFLLYLSDVEEGGETMFPYEVGVVG